MNIASRTSCGIRGHAAGMWRGCEMRDLQCGVRCEMGCRGRGSGCDVVRGTVSDTVLSAVCVAVWESVCDAVCDAASSGKIGSEEAKWDGNGWDGRAILLRVGKRRVLPLSCPRHHPAELCSVRCERHQVRIEARIPVRLHTSSFQLVG